VRFGAIVLDHAGEGVLAAFDAAENPFAYCLRSHWKSD